MLCRYFICAAYMTRNIPDNLSWEEAAVVQPLAVAIHVARRAGIHARQTVAVLYVLKNTHSCREERWLIDYSGCGPLGLLVIAVAKAYGVQKVIAFDIQESRVDFAVQYGADVGVTTSRKKPSDDAWTYAKDCMSSVREKYQLEPGVDVTVEASGAEVCTQMALALLKPGGTCELLYCQS
jgi:D-xylulose reductase